MMVFIHRKATKIQLFLKRMTLMWLKRSFARSMAINCQPKKTSHGASGSTSPASRTNTSSLSSVLKPPNCSGLRPMRRQTPTTSLRLSEQYTNTMGTTSRSQVRRPSEKVQSGRPSPQQAVPCASRGRHRIDVVANRRTV